MTDTGPKRMSRPLRRQALLHAAAGVVEDGGVGAFSFEAMADRAGVAKTLPYAYFESADEVLTTLFDEVIGGLDDEIDGVVAGGGPFDDVVRRSLGVWFDAAKENGRLVAGLLDGRAAPGLAERVRRRDRRSHKLWHDLVVAQLGIEDPDAHVLAVMLNTSATGVVQLWASKRAGRADLLDSFVTMATGAAAALQHRLAGA